VTPDGTTKAMRCGSDSRALDQVGDVERRARDEEAEPVREGGPRARADTHQRHVVAERLAVAELRDVVVRPDGTNCIADEPRAELRDRWFQLLTLVGGE
jgi:hypothetical protein